MKDALLKSITALKNEYENINRADMYDCYLIMKKLIALVELESLFKFNVQFKHIYKALLIYDIPPNSVSQSTTVGITRELDYLIPQLEFHIL